VDGAVDRGHGEGVVADKPTRELHDSRMGLVLRASMTHEQQRASRGRSGGFARDHYLKLGA
jgi:hypothetical protein